MTIPPYTNVSKPCLPSPCGDMQCDVFGGQVAICNPCMGQDAIYNPACRPECLTNADCPFDKACLGQACIDPCPGSCGVNALCSVVVHTPVCSCPEGYAGNPFEHCSIPASKFYQKVCSGVMTYHFIFFQDQKRKPILAKTSAVAQMQTA